MRHLPWIVWPGKTTVAVWVIAHGYGTADTFYVTTTDALLSEARLEATDELGDVLA